MLVRYIKNGDSRTEELAKIYTLQEHGIKRSYIDRDAEKIIHRLTNHGYQAFIVGGAVRDLLLGRKPKDFDIVTDAHPGKIHKIFWNSRIIGRRFRLVHVYSGNKITEVSTFRCSDLTKSNAFGTMKEDVVRRDFSFNALYYSPEQEYLYDYVGGFDDIIDKKICPIMPVDRIFIDDPVRIIRAVRYGMITGFSLTGKLLKHLREDAAGLRQISSSRLTEEIIKILQSGKSEKIFEFFIRYDILGYILPNMHAILSDGPSFFEKLRRRKHLLENLRELDRKIQRQQELPKGETFTAWVKSFISINAKSSREELEAQYKDVFHRIKYIIKPITPPNKDVEQAVRNIFRSCGLSPPKKRRYGKARRKK